MKIQVRFNEEGALRNQRFAFTDRFTLVTECWRRLNLDSVCRSNFDRGRVASIC